LSVWKTWDEDIKAYYYHIGTEGSIGYKNLHGAIEYYKQMCNGFKQYLDNNNIKKIQQSNQTIYRSRDIEVVDDKDNECVWVYTSEPSLGFNSLYDTYLWLVDVTKQLESINP